MPCRVRIARGRSTSGRDRKGCDGQAGRRPRAGYLFLARVIMSGVYQRLRVVGVGGGLRRQRYLPAGWLSRASTPTPAQSRRRWSGSRGPPWARSYRTPSGCSTPQRSCSPRASCLARRRGITRRWLMPRSGRWPRWRSSSRSSSAELVLAAAMSLAPDVVRSGQYAAVVVALPNSAVLVATMLGAAAASGSSSIAGVCGAGRGHPRPAPVQGCASHPGCS